MATWGVHLRIAGAFFDKIPPSHHREFAIGSVAPDCGYGKKDSFGEFTPPPSVTHWSPTGAKRDCRYKDFYKTYIAERRKEKNDGYWFYLGYYIHLLTDIMWSVTMYMPTRIKFKEQYDADPSFLGTIKKDWNDIDAAYLQKTSHHPIYDIIRSAGEVRDYLPYYEHGQLTKQIRYIADYYMNYGEVEEREYLYTTEAEIENFIKCASYLLRLVAEREELI